MKRLSIKGRVTLWYTLFMLLLTVIVLAALFLISDRQILSAMRARLERAVSGNLEEVESDGEGGVTIDEELRNFQDGVYLILYDGQGNHIHGQLPYQMKASQTPALYNGKIQEERIQGVKWLFLDMYKPLDGGSGVWLRGMISQSEAGSGMHIVMRIFVFLIPLFVIGAAAGGYYIIYRAFAPIEEMRKMADEITDGNDLSRRIRLGSGGDEIHQLADTFDRMLERIQAAYEREKKFTSDVSHELRTPVSVIAAQAEYALRYHDISEELRERLQKILDQSRKMSALISQLLVLARADQGQTKLQKETINVSELMEIIADEERERAEQKGIEIYADCQPELHLEGDETLLMRCFMNLVENAIAYGKENGHIWISLTGQEDIIQGYVRDDGIGIEQEDLPKIWERFYQVDPSRSSSASGSSGLGLAMVKWIVEAHGGSVTAESRPGQGTIFHFRFRRSEGETDSGSGR